MALYCAESDVVLTRDVDLETLSLGGTCFDSMYM